MVNAVRHYYMAALRQKQKKLGHVFCMTLLEIHFVSKIRHWCRTQ